MLMIENKKASILLILKVLEEYSDEDHFLTQQDIIDKVDELYGIELERKSVAFSISLLQELDYDINKSPRGGYALLSRSFDNSEIRYIVDSLFSSKSISGKQAAELSNKLNSCLSKYQRKDYNFIYKSNEINRSENKDLFYTLELIEEAKRRGKRVSFQYLTFDESGKPYTKMDGFRYIVSPYYSANSNGRYFLICNYREKYRAITWFRIDYMLNPKIEEDWPIKSIESLKEVKDFVQYGASPRAAIAVSEAARAIALIEGRPSVGFEDVKKVFVPALNHRILLNYKARFESLTSEILLRKIMDNIKETTLD